ncbi:MAG: triose-phosphate isomerase [Pseudopedobacter saltans]|uniref:Triosephosphate isomerase n=1 Tax=Pseudopedobacter saltans TaxID=151895 RepID=A0A2W5GDC5_9SPHI|nr:MAG: triose-phosphate isomerase [Pseudopedobacter saltans]
MRNQIAAANWKMNLTWQQGQELLNSLVPQIPALSDSQQVIIAVPFPYLAGSQELVAGKQNVYIAAQNISDKKSGAYTGEVSGEMLASIGIQYVLVGHSERREYYNETNEILAAKLDRALENGIKPIFCCGEPLDIREKDTHNDFVEIQLKESLFHLSEEQLANVVIAYEPIWAIGTGKTATSQQAEDIQKHIRSVVASKYGDAAAEKVSILYGGSVKAANAVEIFSQPDVDGGLVGGASLNAEEFLAIINALQ